MSLSSSAFVAPLPIALRTAGGTATAHLVTPTHHTSCAVCADRRCSRWLRRRMRLQLRWRRLVVMQHGCGRDRRQNDSVAHYPHTQVAGYCSTIDAVCAVAVTQYYANIAVDDAYGQPRLHSGQILNDQWLAQVATSDPRRLGALWQPPPDVAVARRTKTVRANAVAKLRRLEHMSQPGAPLPYSPCRPPRAVLNTQ